MMRVAIPFGDGAYALFRRLQARPYAFLLDSALEAGGLGRYSVIGYEPARVFELRGTEAFLGDGAEMSRCAGDAWDVLRSLLAGKGSEPEADGLPFGPGAYGWIGYEAGLVFERVGMRAKPGLAMPDAALGFYDTVVVCDEVKKRLFVVSIDAREAQRVAREIASLRAEQPRNPRRGGDGGIASGNLTLEAYVAGVARIREYIAAGDVYQVNLSQRFSVPLGSRTAFEIYERLRERSPAPFSAYLGFGAVALVSSSPERFLSLQGGKVSTRPIKGTRPRGRTPEEDARLGAELVASAKDRAELLMIVDLERNDLGRVCVPGSIRVEDLYQLEGYPTVWHLVGNVSGLLAPGRDVIDLLRATFPGGSITGAPKVRAMEIIDELEPTRRNAYTGAIGYLGFDGNAELSIAIRTIQCVGGEAHYHVGSGVVWDSSPMEEHAETLAKGRALADALGLGELRKGVA